MRKKYSWKNVGQKYKQKKANEATEIRKERLAKLRDMRKYQSSDKREKSLFDKRQGLRQNIMNESSEARKSRLLKKCQQSKQAVENETAERRERRLLAKRQHKKQVLDNETKGNKAISKTTTDQAGS